MEGGRSRFAVDVEGKEYFFGGTVLVYDPPRELTLQQRWEFADPTTAPTYWTIRLVEFADGTLVELFEHGFEGLGDKGATSHADHERAWDTKHLDALREIVTADCN